MRSKVRTRIGSMLVCLAMLLSLLPVTALAAEGTECTESDCAHVAANRKHSLRYLSRCI